MRHVIVIGAGIVGLATAHHLLKEGVRVTVVDRDPEGDKASFGNAGGIAVTEVIPASIPGVLWKVPGWLSDPLGPLAIRPSHAPRLLPWLLRFAGAGKPSEVKRIAAALTALNARVYEDLLPLLAEHGLHEELQQFGALTVYEKAAAFDKDAAQWDLRRACGVEVHALSGNEARDIEPALGPSITRGVFMPQWSHVKDPKTLVDKLRQSLAARGLFIQIGEVCGIHSGLERDAVSVCLSDGRRLLADKVVVAAGAWSGLLARRIGDKVLLESERGYNTTLPAPGVALSREIIFAERHFVATPLSCGLRIGGAAEFGGLYAPANFKRSQALARLAALYLPGLRLEGGTCWAGHRPATPDSLPVIGVSPRNPAVIYAFGHGHLGLTQAATTGRLVSDIALGKPPLVDLAPYAISRFN
ncbi:MULTISPECIES: NAD(P)/FAD-dependent oxidoreductase [Pseudomonas]|uniref:FAD-binding oxidoreductase n=1 Tax=Pseudomonas azadiae TaxID=2843612 RepID=A0ABS6P6I1_9PSED|nr:MULTISPECIES: FAD-binding oxidoreductase [Pseudomonas]MBV4455809.1 FAD-binding oxidoreductase [Pseudomonas azadiae]NMF41699.1 FAD-binding oxidoreductase [Pseudomonas sp. SWRI 103]